MNKTCVILYLVFHWQAMPWFLDCNFGKNRIGLMGHTGVFVHGISSFLDVFFMERKL